MLIEICEKLKYLDNSVDYIIYVFQIKLINKNSTKLHSDIIFVKLLVFYL